MLHPCVLFSLSSSLLLWIFLKCDHSPIKMMILSELHASFFVQPQPFVVDLLAVVRGMTSQVLLGFSFSLKFLEETIHV